jgi:uncharacterized metal-binding protein YceD (DUF177 family)
MAVTINLHQLEHGVVRLKGELTPADLDLEGLDELIQVEEVVNYEFTAEKLENSILVQGYFGLKLRCECARCLKPFVRPLEFGNWTCHLPLEGEDAAPVANDCVDLTPYLREDIVLEFPQHPLCQPDCDGLPGKSTGKIENTGGMDQTSKALSDWVALNKLKL